MVAAVSYPVLPGEARAGLRSSLVRRLNDPCAASMKRAIRNTGFVSSTIETRFSSTFRTRTGMDGQCLQLIEPRGNGPSLSARGSVRRRRPPMEPFTNETAGAGQLQTLAIALRIVGKRTLD